MSDDVKPLDYLRAIRDSRDLSAAEKLVAAIVTSHAGPDGKDAHPGEKLLAAETGYTEKTVRKHLHSLREKGWLLMLFSGRGGSHGKASAYHLSIPTGNGYRLTGADEGTSTGSRYRLGEVPTGNQRPPNRYSETAQPVISDRPTGNGYRTNALRNALGNDPVNAAVPETPAAPPPAVQGEKIKPEKTEGQAAPGTGKTVRRSGKSSSREYSDGSRVEDDG